MSLIGINIKKIRSVKGLNQTEFANLFGLTRANIGSYEEQRAEPKLDVIIKIAKYFKLSIDKLVTKELTVNEISNFNTLEKVLEKKHTNFISIPYVSKTDLIKYCKEKGKKSYLRQLKQISAPFISLGFIAFYNEGNELYFNNKGFLHGDILFTQEQNKEDGLFLGLAINTKEIAKGLIKIKDKMITITPLNPNYPTKEMELSKSTELRKIVGRYTTNVLDESHLAFMLTTLEQELKSSKK